MERLIYFDHNSTAPYSPSVRKYLEQGILEDWHNPSSIYPQSQILSQKIKEYRKVISEHLNCSPKHLFFTSGGTESINTILSLETLKINNISSIISSALEHHATLKKIEYLIGYQNPVFYQQHQNLIDNQTIKYVPILPNNQGEINLNKLEEKCSKYPFSLVSLLSANNETGVITDISEASKIAGKYNCLVHVDAVQSLGKMPVDLEKWDVDFASFSGHKIGAMKGIGLLYARKPFAPLIYGGGQERGFRPGTYNYPAIQSFKLAVEDIDLEKQEYVRKLRDYLESNLLGRSAGRGMETSYNAETQKIIKQSEAENSPNSFKVNCQKASRLPNTSSIYCGGMSNQAILLNLAQKGIEISAGSACNAGSPEPSHVMVQIAFSMDQPKDYANSCIRISLSPSNKKEEVDILISSLKEAFKNWLYNEIKRASHGTYDPMKAPF